MSARVYDGESWVTIKNAYIYHEGIGFVALYSIRCFVDNEWRAISLSERELAGV